MRVGAEKVSVRMGLGIFEVGGGGEEGVHRRVRIWRASSGGRRKRMSVGGTCVNK